MSGWEWFFSVSGLAVSVVTAIFTGYLAIVALRLTAKPRVAITPLVSSQYAPGEEASLTFLVQNIGSWYGKPAASELVLWVNVDPACEPLQLLFGSALERADTQVMVGKGGAKYLMARGIWVTYGEPPETIKLDVRLPVTPGRYAGWLTAHSDEGDLGAFPFEMNVA